MLTGKQIDDLITGKSVIKGDGWHQRMNEWHGLRPSKANPCPYYVTNSHCRLFTGRTGASCICQQAYDVLDHKAVWMDETRARVFTSEIYNYNGEMRFEAFDLLREWARRRDLRIDVSSRSPWYPTRTTLIMIRKPDKQGF